MISPFTRVGIPTNLRPGGTFDLLLTKTINKNPAKWPEGQVVFSLYDVPRKVTGIHKVSQYFLRTLLTTKGSDPIRPEKGTQFPQLIALSNVHSDNNNSEFISDITSCVEDASNQCRSLLNIDNINPDEALDRVEIIGIQALEEGWFVTLYLITLAGEGINVAVPSPSLDLLSKNEDTADIGSSLGIDIVTSMDIPPAIDYSPVPTGDPYIGNVVFLWHANNTLNCTIGGPLLQDGTGTFVTTNAFNVYSYSNNGSVPSGGGSNVLYWFNSNSLDLNSSDFTMELRVFVSSRQSRPRYLMNITDSTGATEYAIALDTDGTHQGVLGMFKVSSTTYAYVGITTQNTLPLNQWNHIAFTRHGNDYYLFVNGVLSIGGTYSSNYRNGGGVKDLYIANSSRFFIDALAGLVDELEITRGVARYTSNFDVSSIPIPLLDN